jgi:plastocyanin
MDVRRRLVPLTLALAVLATAPALYAAAAPTTGSPTLSGTVSGTDLKHHHIGVKVTKGAAAYKGKTITVVLHNTKVVRLGKTVPPSAIKRNDRVTVTYRVEAATHKVFAIKIVDTGPKPKPVTRPSPTPTPTSHVVIVTTTEFMYDGESNPASITVPAGTTVEVRNDGSAAHTLTQGDSTTGPKSGGFDSGQVQPGQTVTVMTFTTPGTYQFFCENHTLEGMRGSITVTG